MALDAEVSDLLKGELLGGIRLSSARIAVAGENLMQGLGVIQNVLIQQGGGVADDAATMAALRTAVYVPHPSSGDTKATAT